MLSSVRSPVHKSPMCTGGDPAPGKRVRGGNSPTNANSDADAHSLSLSKGESDVVPGECSGDDVDVNIFDAGDDNILLCVLITKSDDVNASC